MNSDFSDAAIGGEYARLNTGRIGGRRSAIAAGLAASPLLLLAAMRPAAAANAVAFQDIVAAGADPTGTRDSSAAVAAAFAKLPSTGGCLYCPAGIYLLNAPVVMSGKPVVIKGDGSIATTFIMGHTGTAFSFVPGSIYRNVGVLGMTIAGPSSAIAACAILVAMPAAQNDAGYQSCYIDDVGIGSPLTNLSNGCQIRNGLILENVWKSQIRNVRMFGPFNTKLVSSFVTLASPNGGKCIDTQFVNCYSDGASIGFNIVGYSEGIHVNDSVLIGNVGVTSADVPGTKIAVLGFYMHGCEVQCVSVALRADRVWSAWISNTHFGASATTAPDAVVNATNCVNFFMNDIWITGQSIGSVFGLIFSGGAINRVNGLTLENLAAGVLFTNAVTGTLILGLQMVNQNVFPTLMDTGIVVDSSGNTANNAQWQPSSGALRSLY